MIAEQLVKVLYFASFAEKLQCREEMCSLLELRAQKLITEKQAKDTTEIKMTIDDLKHYLGSRGQEWQTVFSMPSVLVAVNLVRVKNDFVLSVGDEVAFFPPVTGG